MLEPDARVVLLGQLRPPAGYHLAGAVATTFTLSLSAALVAPLAFASFGHPTTTDPLAVLEAVRSSADRVDIFAQAGQIAVPRQASDLMAFLEPMVHPVTAPRGGYLFHPKIWFLHFTAPEAPDVVRLLCSSRNLVESTAWDAMVTMEGHPVRGRLGANEPLARLIELLPRRCVQPLSEHRAQRVQALADLARRVEWELPVGVDSIALHAWGVPRLAPTANFNGNRHLIVAPFCDPDGIRHLAGTNRNPTLVSRTEALNDLPAATLGLDIAGEASAAFVLDPMAGLGADESAEPATPAASELVGLHAKVTVVEANWRARVFVGSPNATAAAFGGNVEFAVELGGPSTQLGIKTFMGDDAPLRAMLQPYRRDDAQPPPDDDELRQLRNALRALAAVPFSLQVGEGDGGYALRLSSAKPLKLPPGHVTQVGLLSRPGVTRQLGPGAVVDITFDSVALADITPFVTLSLAGPSGLIVSTVLHAPLTNDLPDRLDEILTRQIDTREKFLRFLALLLSPDALEALWASMSGEAADADGAWQRGGQTGPGVLELVVDALVGHPEALTDVDKLVRRLSSSPVGAEVLPAGFAELWASVSVARDSLRGGRP